MADSKTSRSLVILRWTTTRRAPTPTSPPIGQEPPFSLQVPTGALWFWVGSGTPRSYLFPPYWSLQMAGCPRGVRGELRGALCCTVCSDREKQLESGACGSFCVLCLTGKAGPGTLGRATTEAEAHQHWLSILCSTGRASPAWFSKPWTSRPGTAQQGSAIQAREVFLAGGRKGSESQGDVHW